MNPNESPHWQPAPHEQPLNQPAYPPSQQQYYPAPPGYPQPYQQPQIVYVQKLPRSGYAVAALVCALVGLFLWCLAGIPNILAVVFGHLATHEINKAGRDSTTGRDVLRGRVMADWALILGYPGALWGVFYIVYGAGHGISGLF